jgi:hypothetical protein
VPGVPAATSLIIRLRPVLCPFFQESHGGLQGPWLYQPDIDIFLEEYILPRKHSLWGEWRHDAKFHRLCYCGPTPGPDLGFYSNKSRGLRKKADTDDQVPALIEPEISSKEFRKNWARLIQKIYPVKFPKGNPIKQGK